MAANKQIVLTYLNVLLSSAADTIKTLDQIQALNLTKFQITRTYDNSASVHKNLIDNIAQNRVQIQILAKGLIGLCTIEVRRIKGEASDEVFISQGTFSQIQQLVAQVSSLLGKDINEINQETSLKKQELKEIESISKKITDLKLELKKGAGSKTLSKAYKEAIENDKNNVGLNIEHYKLMYDFYFSFKTVLEDTNFADTIDLNKLLKVNFNDLQTDFYNQKKLNTDSNSVMKILIENFAKKATP